MIGALWIILIVTLLGFVLTYWAERNIWESLLGTFGGFVISGIIVLFMIMVARSQTVSVEQYPWRTEEIYSLKDVNSGLKGSFILGTGSISSTWYYQSYVETDDGFHKEKYDQDITYIKETDSVKPKIEKYIRREHLNWFDTWLTGSTISDSRHYVKYILYVPENTIIKNFRLE